MTICSREIHANDWPSCFFLLLLAGDISSNPGPTAKSGIPIKIACANLQSLRNKGPATSSFISDKGIHCLMITETWIKDKDTKSFIAELTPPGFVFHHRKRIVGAKGKTKSRDGGTKVQGMGKLSGGGVGCLVDKSCPSVILDTSETQTFESIAISTTLGSKRLILVTLYRTQGSYIPFMEEFQDFLVYLTSLPLDFVIAGDFNIHLDQDCKSANAFRQAMDIFNLTQHVNFPTHKSGHWLDLVITSNDNSIIGKIGPSERLSDHTSVIATLQTQTNSHITHEKISYRSFKSFEVDKFREDILTSQLITKPDISSSSNLYNQYHLTLSKLLDKHAPLRTCTPPSRPKNPWMTDLTIMAKRKKRQLERVCQKTHSCLDRLRFNSQVHLCNRLMSKAKHNWYSKLVSESKDNPRKLWDTINTILHRKKTTSLPDCTSSLKLANSFKQFFADKIKKIRDKFPSCTPDSSKTAPHSCPPPLSNFGNMSEKMVRKLILSSPSKSCGLDPCPTVVVKDCIDVLLTPITTIINMSLSEGTFPDTFKLAHVTPLLKKPSLNRNDLKNYRPVSGLNYISKLIEKAVAGQIKEHLKYSNTDNPLQSAYKLGHSTETALLHIQGDILAAMDDGKVTALTLLDLSAAFDTIDHNLLLCRLTEWFGVRGSALDWIRSYLTNRSQAIKIAGVLSDPESLMWGVPQGSVLGPLLFTMYTAPLSKIIQGFGLKHHLYADDTQIYISFSPKDSAKYITKVQKCLSAVEKWMHDNMLKLNPEKTEFLVIGNKVQRNKLANDSPANLMGQKLESGAPIRNLGVMFDQDFTFEKHIRNICKMCFYHIRDLRRIRPHLSKSLAVSVANALVSSRLDYCNSLLLAVSSKYTNSLQRAQNCLARVVTKSSHFARVTPLLRSLHWLPIKSRIEFKINLLTYKSLQTGQPTYLSNQLKFHSHQKTLRSDTRKLLHPGPIPKRNYGFMSFSVAAPRLWNALPGHIRDAQSVGVFRKALKTHLFSDPP